jgi:hypothetical protein
VRQPARHCYQRYANFPRTQAPKPPPARVLQPLRSFVQTPGFIIAQTLRQPLR